MTRDEKCRFLEDLYYSMSPLLARYAITVLSDIDDAEDAVQEVFRIACTKVDTIVESQNPKGWLMNTLKHVLQNQQRAKARYISLLCYLMTIPKNTLHTVHNDIDLLYEDLTSSEDYALLKKLYLEELSINEIAIIEGITYEACKKRVQRARARLVKYMEENNLP